MGNLCKKKQQDRDKYEQFIYGRRDCLIPDNTNEYFKVLKTQMRRFYKENQNNQFNISISLDKRDFNSTISSKLISINPNQKFIYWKDYFTKFLTKRSNHGYRWANNLLEYFFIIKLHQ
jgi:hypothetical protein